MVHLGIEDRRLRSRTEDRRLIAHAAILFVPPRSPILRSSVFAKEVPMPWTKERLEEVARSRLGGAKLIVLANREPFMQACSGTWVAHASGDADREVSDERGRVGVPPENPTYTLRRVWLSKQE